MDMTCNISNSFMLLVISLTEKYLHNTIIVVFDNDSYAAVTTVKSKVLISLD